ncbi:carbohydrate ABC transporter permease [Paenibacillus thalictri]|uniref:Carbohydrate ABC transporter permease n=1 Tax=Paenibacillus thalictri TaxID=2527873 RepID=A0A4Q9DRU5_9BACL|nr:carbohydrate ABC transporter permease [Paenibacillus thalictri]TBL79537.1 carbohydrate ABC transporter permease [Paenibacillus thalictri]
MSFVASKKPTTFDYVNYTVLSLISLACVFPFIYVFSVSFTDPKVYVPLKFYLFPDQWSLSAYKYILSTNSFLNALKSTVFITLVGTALSVVVSFMFSYALTKKAMPGRGIMLGAVVFTLVFNAGILPSYLLIKQLGLLNSHWSLIWSGLSSAWSVIVIKSFLESLPSELEDSARIDGCSDIGVFLRIVIPLSMPAIAAFTLFFAVTYWNTYFNALIYLSDSKKWTLQVLVKTLVIDSDSTGVGQAGSGGDDRIVPQETIRMASIMLAMAPILIVYPFLQKHFAKGVMLGSIKG